MNTSKKSGKAKKILAGLLIFILVIILAAAVYLNSLMPIITGYAAKNLCSAVFVSERNQEDVENTDLDFSFISKVKNTVDRENMTVTSRFLWGKSIAVYRERFGATLLVNKDVDNLKTISFPAIDPGYSGDTLAWPMGDILSDTLAVMEKEKLADISSSLVNENAYGGNAFAFMVLHKGIPVAEAYKPGFNKDTRLLSWSMAKSVTNALVGIRAYDSTLSITDSELLTQWPDDRKDITLENLMQMQSGLTWNEDYGIRSDVTVMLHCEPDLAQFAFSQPLEYDPGTHWYYSSGTTNIVSYILRQQFENDDDYYAYPHEELFYRIGITDAVFETDETGTLVGSSYLYMTARDYARFALLYMNDGMFNGKRILPEGWVDYTVIPASDSDGQYGSFFWLNRDGGIDSAPEDMFMCIGHDGQRIFMIPSRELIVVVLGYSPDNTMDFNKLIGDIIAAL